MPYSVVSKKTGTTYFLHARTTKTSGGTRTLYFFSKEKKDGHLEALPDGYTVVESEQTGLPLLKKK